MEEFTDFKIIIVDDEQDVIDVTKDMLQEVAGLNSYGMLDPEEALEHLRENKVDLILLDWRMKPITGDIFIERFREFDKKTMIVLQTGAASELPQLETLIKYNIQGYIAKDEDPELTIIKVIAALKSAKLIRENDMLKYKTEFIGNRLDEVSDEFGDKLIGIGSNVNRIVEESTEETIRGYAEKAKEGVESGYEIIKAICFNSPKSRSLSEIFEFVRILNKYKTGEVGMSLCSNLSQDINFAYYKNSCLVYLLSETVMYIREQAKREPRPEGGALVRKVTLSAEVLEGKVNVILDSEFGYEYKKEFVDKLCLIASEEPEGFIDINVNDNKLIIGFTDVTEDYNKLISVGRNQNDKITEYSLEG